MSQGNQDAFRLGFLTALEDGERGFVGGLLVTNRFGRPLEFQCTAPVKPNRSQQILYGPTLRPFVLGELLGRTLLEKTGVKPHLVLVDSKDQLELRSSVSTPIGLLVEANSSDSLLKIGRHGIAFHVDHGADAQEVSRHASLIPQDADLKEPFERIREALTETLRLGTTRTA